MICDVNIIGKLPSCEKKKRKERKEKTCHVPLPVFVFRFQFSSLEKRFLRSQGNIIILVR